MDQVDTSGQPLVAEIIIPDRSIDVTTDAMGNFLVTNLPAKNMFLYVGVGANAQEFYLELNQGDSIDLGTLTFPDLPDEAADF